MAALVAAAGFRPRPVPCSSRWRRSSAGPGATSGAVSLNLVIYGLTAPFAAALMERSACAGGGDRAGMVSLGAGLTLMMTVRLAAGVLWGVLGVGTGAMALVFGAIIANRWFVRHRGLVTGLFSAASSSGQVMFLPCDRALAPRSGVALGREPDGGVLPGGGPGGAPCCGTDPRTWGTCPTAPPVTDASPRSSAAAPDLAGLALRALPGRAAADFWALFLTSGCAAGRPTG